MLVMLISVTSLVAQSGEDALKSAKKSFDSYKLNGDVEALKEASANLELAMQDSEVANDPKALLEAGDIYKEATVQYVTRRSLDAADKARGIDMPATKAAKAYMAAYNATDKKGTRKAAIKGLEDIQGSITNEGIYFIQDGTENESFYGNSYTAFQTNMMVSEFLEKNGGKSSLTEESVTQDKYYGGLAALLAKNYDGAQPLFEELMGAEYDDSAIYSGLFTIYTEKEMKTEAADVLQKGRTRYPDDSGLLFNEINFLLAEGRLDELTERLESAIAKEPDNISLYGTLAGVYQELYKKAKTDGDVEKEEMFYQKAEAEYQRGLEKDPSSARMISGLGSMIYNRAAGMTQELVELGNDFSKEGQKKYDELQEVVNVEFAKALPFFQKAEMSEPGDVNTLIALKEIYARMDEYEVSNEFKERIEKVQAGEKVAGSYFKEKGM